MSVFECVFVCLFVKAMVCSCVVFFAFVRVCVLLCFFVSMCLFFLCSFVSASECVRFFCFCLGLRLF